MSKHVILLVEDDVALRRVLRVTLRTHGYDVVEAGTGSDALVKLETRAPDAMILDLGLPDMDGVDVARATRRSHELPIIVLSAREDEKNQVHALDSGADDYVTKPYREAELMARLRVALRRGIPLGARRDLRVGALRLDLLQHRAYIEEREITLTATEFKLLRILALEADRVVTHQTLLREVWGPNRLDAVQYLRVYVKQLREKVEQDPARPTRILTALGVGYRLVDLEAQS